MAMMVITILGPTDRAGSAAHDEWQVADKRCRCVLDINDTNAETVVSQRL